MLVSEIKAVTVHYRLLPLDSRVDFFICNSRPPFEKCITPGVFIRINTVSSNFVCGWNYLYLNLMTLLQYIE